MRGPDVYHQDELIDRMRPRVTNEYHPRRADLQPSGCKISANAHP